MHYNKVHCEQLIISMFCDLCDQLILAWRLLGVAPNAIGGREGPTTFLMAGKTKGAVVVVGHGDFGRPSHLEDGSMAFSAA